MTLIHIRTMKAEDRHSVIALLQDSEPWTRLAYTRADWEQYFCPLPQGRESFVTEQDGHITGIAVLRQKFLLGDYLELLGIAKNARRAGTGKALLAHIESLVFARTTNLFACVSDFNQPARNFYARQGYQEIGPLPHLIIKGSAEILLRKSTGPARS
ncbi:MAG TPA: GNAT family N-acetyltransferase [Nitrospira sp.]